MDTLTNKDSDAAATLGIIVMANYSDYVTRSRRSDTMVALTEMANLQSKFFANNLSYTTTVASLPYPTTSAEGHYVLSIPSVTTNEFTLHATAIGVQAAKDPNCPVFQLNSLASRRRRIAGRLFFDGLHSSRDRVFVVDKLP